MTAGRLVLHRFCTGRGAARQVDLQAEGFAGPLFTGQPVSCRAPWVGSEDSSGQLFCGQDIAALLCTGCLAGVLGWEEVELAEDLLAKGTAEREEG